MNLMYDCTYNDAVRLTEDLGRTVSYLQVNECIKSRKVGDVSKVRSLMRRSVADDKNRNQIWEESKEALLWPHTLSISGSGSGSSKCTKKNISNISDGYF